MVFFLFMANIRKLWEFIFFFDKVLIRSHDLWISEIFPVKWRKYNRWFLLVSLSWICINRQKITIWSGYDKLIDFLGCYFLCSHIMNYVNGLSSPLYLFILIQCSALLRLHRFISLGLGWKSTHISVCKYSGLGHKYDYKV